MRMQPVQSSHIEQIGYDRASKTMAIQFHGGRTYQYANVPPEAVDEFEGAESKGKHFRDFIKGKFEHEKA